LAGKGDQCAVSERNGCGDRLTGAERQEQSGGLFEASQRSSGSQTVRQKTPRRAVVYCLVKYLGRKVENCPTKQMIMICGPN